MGETDSNLDSCARGEEQSYGVRMCFKDTDLGMLYVCEKSSIILNSLMFSSIKLEDLELKEEYIIHVYICWIYK